MYLKSLTVLGFKSFADKTTLNFQPGVTAIVGPNGCGKSNVSDAIRWVLGEQSARALRGAEMADVIFSGTDLRKPMGMAEVSLTLGDVDAEPLRAAGVEVAYNEITITRRIFRDGNSEYFINRVPCRLKDIQQLFLGTGVGRASYSIMAQGHITQIISSKPDDRRIIFEEAAGITRFKAQKKEALRKLEYTEQNLLRVADLIREVKRQIGSLQRQAGKARRYKQIAQELQHLDTQLARHHFDVLQAEIRERLAASEDLRAQIEARSAEVLQREDALAQHRAHLTELEHQIAALQQRDLELKGRSDQCANAIRFNEERLRELADQHTKAAADIAEAEERQRVAEQELASLRLRLATSESDRARHQATGKERQNALRQIEAEIRQTQDAVQQAQTDAFAAAQELARIRNELGALEIARQANAARLEKLSAEKLQLETERAGLESRLHAFREEVQNVKLDVATARGSVEQRQARLAVLQTELENASAEQDQLLEALAEKRSRLAVLTQLDDAREGFDSGTLAALRRSRGVLGSLADYIRVPEQFVVAIENALGHHLQIVLTEQPESAQEILAELAQSRSGRASVAALSVAQHADVQLAFSGDMGPNGDGRGLLERLARGELVPALAVVHADPTVEKLVKSLLGRTFLAPDLASATAQMQNGHAGCDFVTLQGELLNRHGIYTGGYLNGNGNPKAPTSILGRKNQIAELQAELARLQARVAEASRRRGALQSEQTELQAGLQQAQQELRDKEVAVATREGELHALENAQVSLARKIETVVFEIQSLAAQDQEGEQRRASLAAALNELQSRDAACRQRLGELSAALDTLRERRDAATAALTECKVALATSEQLCMSLQEQQAALETRLAELRDLIAQRQRDIAAAGQRREQAHAAIEEARRQIGELAAERERVQAQLAELASQKQAQETDLAAAENALRELRRELAALQEQRGSLEIELAQKNMAVENLRERIQQKYHVNLDEVRSECITITFADEGTARVHVLSPEEMAAAGAATDWDAVARQVEALQRKLDEMGPVNLVAIEEYEETEQRYQFLTRQHDDLVNAKAQLLEVLNRINTQTRQMFTETFEKIRQNFRAMFTEVFGGGHADLYLVDENDVLESGIEIVARPPGKQLKTISLLSGGEQTMTAVALLFSIYQVKPSPFAVLDELDAALDEANINRFVRLLQRFLQHSQFIIMTHNKRTISMADVLYGVTMEEHGVSKIVSVKFHKAGDAESDHRPAPLDEGDETPAAPENPPPPAAPDRAETVALAG